MISQASYTGTGSTVCGDRRLSVRRVGSLICRETWSSVGTYVGTWSSVGDLVVSGGRVWGRGCLWGACVGKWSSVGGLGRVRETWPSGGAVVVCGGS